MRYKKLLLSLLIMLLSGLGMEAATYTVKAGGGGNFTTIQACINTMSKSGGDTCVVYAGTYNERPTLMAGTVGSGVWDQTKANVVTVNSGDTVTVQGFTMASYTTVSGFSITNTSSVTKGCVSIPIGGTQISILNNKMISCGGITEPNGSTGNPQYIHIANNTISWTCAAPPAPSTNGGGCAGIVINGNYHLIENNGLSHVSDGATLYGQYNVWRGNTMHDTSDKDWQNPATNTHVDFIESQCVVPGVLENHHTLYEANTELRNIGSNAHGYLLQSDGSTCHPSHTIIRFDLHAHLGSTAGSGYNLLNNLGGYSYVKMYNNTTAYMGAQFDGTDTFAGGSPYGAEINSIFYYGQTFTIPPYTVWDTSGTGFVSSHNLAYCTTGCTFQGLITQDGSILNKNPNFVDTANDDYHLQAGSPAIGVGTYLTTVASSDTGSGTSLVVNDATFFQDGWTMPGVQADWIRVGPSTTVQISSIDYSTNTITLAQGIGRSPGNPVYLYKDSRGNVVLNGSNPDIGAFPSGSSGSSISSPSPNPPSNLAAVVQ